MFSTNISIRVTLGYGLLDFFPYREKGRRLPELDKRNTLPSYLLLYYLPTPFRYISIAIAP